MGFSSSYFHFPYSTIIPPFPHLLCLGFPSTSVECFHFYSDLWLGMFNKCPLIEIFVILVLLYLAFRCSFCYLSKFHHPSFKLFFNALHSFFLFSSSCLQIFWYSCRICFSALQFCLDRINFPFYLPFHAHIQLYWIVLYLYFLQVFKFQNNF